MVFLLFLILMVLLFGSAAVLAGINAIAIIFLAVAGFFAVIMVLGAGSLLWERFKKWESKRHSPYLFWVASGALMLFIIGLSVASIASMD